MYTFCPDCNRQYRVRAVQLAAAHGLVICGYCGRQFNALARLHDRPQHLPLQIPDVSTPAETVLAPTREGIKDDASAPMSTLDHFAIMRPAAHAVPRIDVSEALLDTEPVSRDQSRTRAWSAGVLVMLTLLALQFVWFNRDDVLQAYPQLTPWVERFCERYHCNLVRQRDLAAIRILNRDVRLHPQYADTLLVNATMANQSGLVQPFPKIQFTLFDTNGQMLAYREFTVEEYLDRSIDVSKGMAPGQPVHFVFEVTGPTQDAVSFEFRFL